MRHTTAVILTAVLVTACSAGSPVGYFDSSRIVSESTAFHVALDEPSARLRQAQDVASRAQDAAAHADELTAASKKDAMDKAKAELEDAQKVSAAAGKALDDRINVITAKLATARRMTLVFSLNGRPSFAAPGTDLTNDVIEALDGGDEVARAARAAKDAVKKYKDIVEAAGATGPPKKEKTK